MPISKNIQDLMNGPGASTIRKMFEEGAVLKKKYGEDAVFDFSIGNPDLEPPREVNEAINEIAANPQKGSHGYMSNAGYVETRLCMAKKVSIEQSLVGENRVTENSIVMSTGAAGALNTVFKAILNPLDEVLVPIPYFVEYGHYVRNHGGVLKTVSSRADLSLDIEAFKSNLSEKTAAIIINSPNNPSGKIYTEENMNALIALLKDHGNKTGNFPFLVLDEPYREICYGGKKPVAMFPFYKNALVVSSFAKNLSLPGERIGYIAVNPQCYCHDELVKACVFATRILGYVNAPAFFQRVISKCWNAKADYSSYEKRMKEITAVVSQASIEYIEPEGAFYLFCRVPPKWGGRDDFAFCDHLKKYNILVAPGTGFGCPGYFRISYCVAEKTILQCALPLKKAVEDWKNL